MATTTRLPGMAPIDGGRFRMGSNEHYPEERPARMVAVESFWMGLHPVTNADFKRFVAATAYVTDAERHGSSLVFSPPAQAVDLRNPQAWWNDCAGATWHSPEGPGSAINERAQHPVVHVSVADARAYCAWAGMRLPREAQWEYAARGGLDGTTYAWGNEFAPDGRQMANTWQGEFPWQNLCLDGFERTSPVGSFPPNGYGLYDMIGNVWEWTEDDCESNHEAASPCCGGNLDTVEPLKIIKGGSYLCAPNYCQRYRPAARSTHAPHGSTAHIGFRGVAVRIQ
jgi:formylglycine-generating enzyme required for sulfatase activity